MADIVLNVDVRDRKGTGGSRAVRREGAVPGILYGGDQQPVTISVKANEFRKALYSGKLLGHKVTLKYGDETQPVIAKAIQFHPVTDEPVHFDLYRVSEHQLIKISVPVHFRNQEASPGLKRGGALNIAVHEIEIFVPADQIPEELVADVTGLDIGASIHIGHIQLPQGASPVDKSDFVVASITGSSAQVSEEAAEGAAEAEGEAEEAETEE
ncbi:MAG TPA: 50S ribosomal protein L25/general stress protein Ctc [Caulobacteraceae bacterium]|nr:50S ribosomal protein L25/general stress protein Ctc [Caulobacteraceae bacterium]